MMSEEHIAGSSRQLKINNEIQMEFSRFVSVQVFVTYDETQRIDVTID